MDVPPGFDPTLILVLNLCGTFIFGLSGGLAGVRAKLDLFGIVVLAAVVGLAGGITMTTNVTIEGRLEAVAELKRRLEAQPPAPDWLDRMIGSFADIPEFDELVRLGREFRAADLPRAPGREVR